MKDVQKFNLKQARDWLSGEVELRIPKAWLVAGGIAFVVLLLIALD